MDQRLAEAARVGDVVALHRILEEDPQIPVRACLAHFADSPLHVAALADQVNFVKEIIMLLPSFVTERNHKGLIPLHMASAAGHVEIVKELLKAKLEDEVNQCLVKDNDGWTPLHYAAFRGRVDAIEELIRYCPESVEEVTGKGETVLHLAVKANQLEAVKVIVERIKSNPNFQTMFRAKDSSGKTIYDLPVSDKQFQVQELLEFKGKTDKASITLDVVPENQIVTPTVTTQKGNSDTTKASQKTEENSNKSIGKGVEEMVLVVASLIATVTYQAGLSPPQTIWKEDMKNSKCIFHTTNPSLSCPNATYYLFMSFNTSGFFASAFLILSRKNSSVVRALLPVALISMMITYITLSVAMSPNALSILILYLFTLAIFLYCILAIAVVRKVIKKVIEKITGCVLNMILWPDIVYLIGLILRWLPSYP